MAEFIDTARQLEQRSADARTADGTPKKQLELFDWRYQDTAEFDELTPGQKEPWKMEISVAEGQIDQYEVTFTAPDGSNRYVMFEVDRGVLKVHCYDHEHEEPGVTVFLDKAETYVQGGRSDFVYRAQRESATVAFAKQPKDFTPTNDKP